MKETDKLKVEMYDDVVKEKNKEYIELSCRFRETCNDIKKKDKQIEELKMLLGKIFGLTLAIDSAIMTKKYAKANILNHIIMNKINSFKGSDEQ